MKHQVMRKRLFMESLVTLGGLAVASIVLFLLISMHEEYQAENLNMKTSESVLSNELASLNDKYTKIQKNHELYDEAKQKNQSERLATNPDMVSGMLRRYGARYGLKNITLEVSAPKEIDNPQYKKKTAMMRYHEVLITCDALTDEDVYKLIESIQKDFTGSVKITSLELAREQKVTNEILIDIASKGHMRMVGVKLKFNWFGISPIDIPEANGGKPNAG